MSISSNVSVLQNWAEVGEAIHSLGARKHHLHHDPAKSWDLWLICQMLQDLDRAELVVDLGAAVLGGVRLLHDMRFRRIIGYDFKFTVFDRALQLRDWLADVKRARHPTLPPYRLRRRDLLKTHLPDASVGGAVCLSVIEHGVDISRFFREMARIIRPGGRLYVSTDYWEPKLDTQGLKMFGMPWTIFCAQEIKAVIEEGARAGLVIGQWDSAALNCDAPVVACGGRSYTYTALRFQRA